MSNDAVAQAVKRALAGTAGATHEDGDPTIDCIGETSCNIAYTVQEPTGISSEHELLLPTRQIWKTLFADPQFQQGVIAVSGPTTTIGGKQHISQLFTLARDRNAASQIDWEHIDGNGLQTLCSYTSKVKEMQKRTRSANRGRIGTNSGTQKLQRAVQKHTLVDARR